MNRRYPWSRWLGPAAISLTLLTSPGYAAPQPAATFHTNDVIAFVGGEDVVEFQRNGYLEWMLATALPGRNLRFRNLAFEGDTVFEQARQLNFPPWEEVMRRVGANVVFVQFGQAESLQGRSGQGNFFVTYEKLLVRLSLGRRRLVLLSPTPFESMPGLSVESSARNADLEAYVSSIRELALTHAYDFVDLFHPWLGRKSGGTRDGIHLNATGHWELAREVRERLGLSRDSATRCDPETGGLVPSSAEAIRQAIIAKNRLWFDYWRPQNWAFLNGDRTEQASSRDHRDPKVRWFPTEMQKFLPLIAAKETEIATLLTNAK